MTRFFTNLYVSILIFCLSNWAFNTLFWLLESSHSLWSLYLSLGFVILSIVILNYFYIKKVRKFSKVSFNFLALLSFGDIAVYSTTIVSLGWLSNWIKPFTTPKALMYNKAIEALKIGWNPIWNDSSNLVMSASEQNWSKLPRLSLSNQFGLSQISNILNAPLFFNLLLIIASLAISILVIKKLLPRNLNFVNKYFWHIILTLLIVCNPITIRLANSLEVIPQLYAMYIMIISSGILIQKKSNFVPCFSIILSLILLAGISYFGFLIGTLLVLGILLFHRLNNTFVFKKIHILPITVLGILGLLGILINLNPYIPKLLSKVDKFTLASIGKLSDKLLGLINQQFNTIIPSISALTQSTKEVIYSKLPFVIENSEITTLKNPNLPLVTSSLGLWFSGVMVIWIIGNGYLYWLTCLKAKNIGDADLEDQMIIKFHHQRNMTIILIHTIFTIFLIFLGLLTRNIFDQNQISFWWLLPCSSLIVWLYFDDTRLDIARQVMTVFLVGNCFLMFWFGIGL